MSLGGGLIRLRTPVSKPCQWREFKALNLAEHHQGIAGFKDNETLVSWANALPLARNKSIALVMVSGWYLA